MDLPDFEGSFRVGYGLSVEERAALEDEMNRRRVSERLASIKFWGRVTGTTSDYLIVYGLLSVLEQPHKKFYYATNKNLTLQQLPELTPEFKTQAAALASRRFVGNPSKLEGADAGEGEEEPEPEPEVEGEDAPEHPKAVRFSEAHRLAYAVHAIEQDCALVPRGAFVVTPTHHIVADPLFIGLSATEAGDLSQYFHFRKATHPSRAHALTKAAVVGTGDFLDTASEDEPRSVTWALRVDEGRGQVSARSLKWPGYFFWHDVATPRFGGVYFGAGQVNADLAFMA